MYQIFPTKTRCDCEMMGQQIDVYYHSPSLKQNSPIRIESTQFPTTINFHVLVKTTTY